MALPSTVMGNATGGADSWGAYRGFNFRHGKFETCK